MRGADGGAVGPVPPPQKARGAARGGGRSLAARPVASCPSRLSHPGTLRAAGEGAGLVSGTTVGPLLLPAAPRGLSSSSASSESPPVPRMFCVIPPGVETPLSSCLVEQLLS